MFDIDLCLSQLQFSFESIDAKSSCWFLLSTCSSSSRVNITHMHVEVAGLECKR